MIKLFFVILLLVPSLSWGATYYIQTDGTAANKAGATGCGAGTAMEEADHNGWGTFVAGDDFVLCNDGGSFETVLTVPISGVSAENMTEYSCDSAPCVLDGNYAIDSNIAMTDRSYISITGLTLQEVDQANIKVNSTGNQSNITIHNNIIQESMHQLIWINTSVGFLTTTVNIYNNYFRNASQITPIVTTDRDSNSYAGVFLDRVTDANIGTSGGNITWQEDCPTRALGVTCADAYEFHDSTDVVLEYNYIYINQDPAHGYQSGGHGTRFDCDANNTTGCDCTGDIVRYNRFITGDDCIYFMGCDPTNPPKIYSNFCWASEDDCMDIRSVENGGADVPGSAWISNMTCLFYDNGLDSEHGNAATAITVENTLFYTEDSTGSAFISFSSNLGSSLMDNSTFDYNIYYAADGDYTLSFKANDLEDQGANCENCGAYPDVCCDFAGWQADSETLPDQNSSTPATAPNIAVRTGMPIKTAIGLNFGSAPVAVNYPERGGQGKTQTEFTQLLTCDAKWSRGGFPDLVTVPAGNWPIGACYNSIDDNIGDTGTLTIGGGLTIE